MTRRSSPMGEDDPLVLPSAKGICQPTVTHCFVAKV